MFQVCECKNVYLPFLYGWAISISGVEMSVSILVPSCVVRSLKTPGQSITHKEKNTIKYTLVYKLRDYTTYNLQSTHRYHTQPSLHKYKDGTVTPTVPTYNHT